MAFKFYIDGFLVDEPQQDQALSSKIKFDITISGNVVTQECKLRWTKENNLSAGTISGYDYLKTLFDDFICNEAELEIYDESGLTTTYLTAKGVIKIPSLQFDEQRNSIVTTVQDNSFYSYVFNNKEINVDFRAILTKNKIETDPLGHFVIDMFNGCTGGFASAIGNYYKGYLIQEVFEFIIRVITDDRVGFQSDYLDALEKPIVLFKGQSLMNPFNITPTPPTPVLEVSFQELFNEINVLKNLFIRIDSSDPANPILRIEEGESRFGVDPIYIFTEPLELTKKVDTQTLYGQVEVGSEITVDGADSPCLYTMNEAISYYGFKREQFFPLGQCNRNVSLNLVNSWVVSNNVIQDILVGGADQYIDDYILVECDTLDMILRTGNAYPYPFFSQVTPPFYYNLGLNNYSKLNRHSTKFETVFGNFQGVGGIGFRALIGDDPSQDITYTTAPASAPNFIPVGGLTVDPGEFVNDTTNGGFDGGNNYNQAAFEYTIPVDGSYSFHIHLNTEIAGIQTQDYFDVQLLIHYYDASSVLIGNFLIGSGGNMQNGIQAVDGTLVIDAVAGEIIVAYYSVTFQPNQGGNLQMARTLTVIWDSYFETSGTPEGGISMSAGNNSIKKLLYEFEYDISQTDWRTITANPNGYFQIIKNQETITAWADDISHDDLTGRTKLILRASNNATT